MLKWKKNHTFIVSFIVGYFEIKKILSIKRFSFLFSLFVKLSEHLFIHSKCVFSLFIKFEKQHYLVPKLIT